MKKKKHTENRKLNLFYLDDSIAVIAELTKELMVVVLTVGQTIPLIVLVTQEWFLTASAGEVLHMPVFTQSCHHPLLYWSPASSTYWNVHLIVTPETEELIDFVSDDSWSRLDFSGCARQLYSTTFRKKITKIQMVSLRVKPEQLK